MDKVVVKELIQDELTPQNITKELNQILFDTLKRERIKYDYHQLKKLLSEDGKASANAAKSIYKFMTTDNKQLNN
jgi:lipid-A-disaccharide synthase